MAAKTGDLPIGSKLTYWTVQEGPKVRGRYH